KRPVPAQTSIDATDSHIQYIGRFNEIQPKDATKPLVKECGWSATSIRARFEGTSIRARLELLGWGGGSNFYAIIDGNEKEKITLAADNRKDWLIAEGLPDTVHTIELVRLGGAWNSSSTFSGFYLDAGKKLLEPLPRSSRRIEFYGDSITEGGMMPDQPFANGYLAYAATTARLLHAEPSVICKSGIGLVKGFTLPQTLPGMFDRGAPMRGDVKWDFSKWAPHVVVINIGQNDVWTNTDPTIFKETYIAFIKTLRNHYPNALIVCALGSMDAVAKGSQWPAVITDSVETYKTETKDTKVETFFFEFLGAKGHPSSTQAYGMAEKLSAFLEAKGPNIWQ
ncbi:MAG: SGNH/GDSL hydrolase family protein, partial [Gloeobacteraceae cyanobacterium ES-bin-144]|nr:SGNH/GDSL hydrolase family protein [Verrucomicrobiales bacterium]